MNIQQTREGTADKEDSRQANSDPGNEESQSTRLHSLHTETSEENEDLAQRNQDNNEERRGFSTDQAAAETLMQLQSRSAPSLSYDSAVVWRTTRIIYPPPPIKSTLISLGPRALVLENL